MGYSGQRLTRQAELAAIPRLNRWIHATAATVSP
jgi:hypothetical protein